MQIQPQFQTVGKLLAGRLFRIPEYQRAYSWGGKQRGDLFDDIRKVGDSPNGSHFMATMVGLRRQTTSIDADEFVELEVVDGQQRLTTITILLRATQLRLSKQEGEKEKRLAAELQSLLVKGDDINLLLLQTNHDSSHIFVDYLREGKRPQKGSALTSADQNLVDAINDCEAFIDEWVRRAGDTPTTLLALIRNRLSVIFHEIEDESLVYTVFEVLNSRGLDVTWFDKLKAMLMAIVFEHGDGGGKKATIAELHRIWRDVYKVIGMRQNLNRETVRFAATLRAVEQPRRPLGEEDAVAELMEQCGHVPKRALEISRWILQVTEAEDQLLASHRLRAVTQIVQARLVAIAILMRAFPGRQDALLRWEKVTFRIYGLAGNDARTAVGDYVRLAWSILRERITQDEIVARLDEIGKIAPAREAAEQLWRVELYPTRAEVIRYFLYRYEEHLAEEAGQKLNESQWNRIWLDEPAKSIEHIRPQSTGASYLHRLGNLTVLTPGTNSKLQDKEPEEKAKAYEAAGLLEPATLAKVIRKNGWTLATVEKRERALLKWAAQEWAD